MFVTPRVLVTTGLLATLAGGLLCLGPPALTPPGQQGGDLPAVRRRLDKERVRGEGLERQRQAVLARMAAKDRVVAELVAGRLTLSQAAARFRGLSVALPDGAHPPGAEGRTEGERLCREVMARAAVWLADHAPDRAAAVAARLEAELRQQLGRDGTVRLPD